MLDVALVLAGNKYTTDYVVQKRKQLDEHSSVPVRLSVLTDNPIQISNLGLRDTRCLLLPNWNLAGPRQLWWYKLSLFSSTYMWQTRSVLYMDLDTIIVGDIAKFWDYEPHRFAICQDFNRAWFPDYPVSNSSVMRFDPTKHVDMYTEFSKNMQQHMRQYRGDQDFITKWFEDKDKVWWPKYWTQSYKWEILHGGSRHGGTTIRYPDDYYKPYMEYEIPNDCSIVVFHGKPDPYDTDFGKKRLTVPI